VLPGSVSSCNDEVCSVGARVVECERSGSQSSAGIQEMEWRHVRARVRKLECGRQKNVSACVRACMCLLLVLAMAVDHCKSVWLTREPHSSDEHAEQARASERAIKINKNAEV
jgi:hypothetical protein